jgi:limonene-1,2-epoxide hydrolase
MASPIEIVNAFTAECGKSKEAMQAAFRAYFRPDTVWENVGFATTTGVDEALALMANFESQAGAATFSVEMLASAAQGNRVLTERVDRLLTASGEVVMALRLMGIFEVEGDKIVAWRDYFDTAPFARGA